MNQTFTMNINPLPTKTWNWLHMNDTSLQESAISEQGSVTVEKPESVVYITPPHSPLSSLETGMGKDIDSFFNAEPVNEQLFTTTQNQKEQQPLRLDFSYTADTRRKNRIGIHLLPGSELTVIMDFSSAEDACGTALVQTKILAEENSLLHLVQIQRLGKEYTLLNDLGADCKANARIETIQLVLGGKDTYLGTQTYLNGDRSSLDTQIGYLTGGESRLDMNLVANHIGKKTESQMNASGVLSGHGSKIFRGTIDFRKGCSASVGNEQENVLLLDDTIVNQTIPLILCDEEDVEGNHGATIGKLDEELLFYLESRGINESDVYTMMAQARIHAICNQIADETTRNRVQEYLKEKGAVEV